MASLPDVVVGGSDGVSDNFGVCPELDRDELVGGMANGCIVACSSGSGESVMRGDNIGPLSSAKLETVSTNFPFRLLPLVNAVEAIPDAFLLASACR